MKFKQKLRLGIYVYRNQNDASSFCVSHKHDLAYFIFNEQLLLLNCWFLFNNLSLMKQPSKLSSAQLLVRTILCIGFEAYRSKK